MSKRVKYGDKNKIGRTVVYLRDKKEMSQGQLMAKLQNRGINLSQSDVSKLEGQFRKVSYEEVRALADIFGMTTEQLYDYKVDE